MGAPLNLDWCNNSIEWESDSKISQLAWKIYSILGICNSILCDIWQDDRRNSEGCSQIKWNHRIIENSLINAARSDWQSALIICEWSLDDNWVPFPQASAEGPARAWARKLWHAKPFGGRCFCVHIALNHSVLAARCWSLCVRSVNVVPSTFAPGQITLRL